MSDVITQMLASRRLERVAVNRDHAIAGTSVRRGASERRNCCSRIVDDAALGAFDWMRQVRNATEYPSDDRPTATDQDVTEAINAASAIVAACEVHLR